MVKKKFKWSVMWKVFGVLLIVVGVVGIFLPILQGFVLIVIGAALLGFEPAKKLLKGLKNRVKGKK